jgi:hypothetical protein
MKQYIISISSLVFISSIFFTACSSNTKPKVRTYEQKQLEIRDFKELDKELKK